MSQRSSIQLSKRGAVVLAESGLRGLALARCLHVPNSVLETSGGRR
jgi:hypothetical protein